MTADTINMHGRETVSLSTGDTRRDQSTNHFIDTGGLWVHASSIVQAIAPKIFLQGDAEVKLVSGGSSITITPGGITIASAGEVVVQGSVIKLN